MNNGRAIYLVGFSGAGKSTIAKLLGEKYNWPVYDLDQIVVERSGMTIPVIFQLEGESGFRVREAEALRAVSNGGSCVVATGGGTVVPSENRRFMASKGWIVCLEGRPETLLARIQAQLKTDKGAIRPMLDAVYPLDQVRALKHARQSVYSLADWIIQTDRLTSEQVAQEVMRAAEILEHSAPPAGVDEVLGTPMRHTLNPDSPPPIVVPAGPWPYYAVVDWDHLSALGAQVKRVLPQARRAAILTDADTWNRLGGAVSSTLCAAGLELQIRQVPPDESIKTPAEVDSIHDWLLGIRLRRDDIFVTIGGGAIDDLGAFAASTYMRGIPLIKVPTSLEGMVDSSIGGKTAVNHPRARNLIGTFFHPRLVWSDVSLLQYEPTGELRAAWAEVIKYGMLESSLLRDQIMGVTLFDLLERNVDQLIALERPTIVSTIARCVALKAQVVAGDERDLGQYRIFLNYGHTVGHALETATNYGLPHGDAVAIGMAVEARLAVKMGVADAETEKRQADLLRRFGLPTRIPKVPLDLLLELINSDKKVFGDAPRWILPQAVGRAMVSRKVAEADLIEILKERFD